MNYNSKINRQRRFNAKIAEVAPENEKFHSLSVGQTPMNIHQDIEGVLGTIASNARPKEDETDRNKILLPQAKTAVFVKCFCPRCVIGHRSHVEHQVFDVQHHVAAANGILSDEQFPPSTRTEPKVVDRALTAGYFKGFPTIHSNELAEKKENNESDLTLMYNPQLDYTWHAEDPEHGHVQKRAAIAADHYLNGCHHDCNPGCKGGEGCKSTCSSNCVGGYKDAGLEKPTEDAQYLLGLKQGYGGIWHHDSDRTKIGNVPTLAHYLAIRVEPNDLVKGDEVKHNLTVDHYFKNPQTIIGKDSRGRDLQAGQYMQTSQRMENGKSIQESSPRFGRPSQKLGDIKDIQHHVYDALLSRGETSLKGWWDAMLPIAHMAHGSVRDGKESREGRVSNLGKRALMTPHRLWTTGRNAKKYIAHVDRGRKDEENELYAGTDVEIPVNTTKLDLKPLNESTSQIRKWWDD